MKSILYLCVAALFLVSTAPLSDDASALMYWSNKDGSTADFMWLNGGSENGLFGDPVVIGNTLWFFPEHFSAESSNGTPAFAYDKLEVEFIGLGGNAITGFKITEVGDYQILGTGSVSVGGTMFITNLGTGGGVAQDDLATVPAMPISTTTYVSGSWSAVAEVSDLLWGHVKLTLDDDLMAITGAGSLAKIQKKVGEVAIGITIIPEPATLAILGLGGLLLRRKW